VCRLPDHSPPTRGAAQAPWWRQVFGTDWRHLEGPYSSVENRMDHAVVHVSWNDATAYSVWAGRWAGRRLPTEAEWEYAARGGLEQRRHAWGDELTPDGEWRCNIWQGIFPLRNTMEDSYLGTAPVDEFEPNGYGLYNVSGNVWEWCSDWFHSSFHAHGPRNNPTGPPLGQAKSIRGGSYLCHTTPTATATGWRREALTPTIARLATQVLGALVLCFVFGAFFLLRGLWGS
jgi:formylglycine-generating enzyme